MKLYKTISKEGYSDFESIGWIQYYPHKTNEGFYLVGDHVPNSRGYQNSVPFSSFSCHFLPWVINDNCFEAKTYGNERMVEKPGRYVSDYIRLIRKIDTWNSVSVREFLIRCAREIEGAIKFPESKEAIRVAKGYAHGNANLKTMEDLRTNILEKIFKSTTLENTYYADSCACSLLEKDLKGSSAGVVRNFERLYESRGEKETARTFLRETLMRETGITE